MGVAIVIMEEVDPLHRFFTLEWRHNERDGVSNHQPHDCLLNRLFKAQIKENIKAVRHWLAFVRGIHCSTLTPNGS